MSEVEEESYELIVAPEPIVKIANEIILNLTRKYSIGEIMKLIKDNSSKNVYVVVSKGNPEKVNLIVDHMEKFCYCCDDPLFIPVPRKFAVLEPDAAYFERTLKANIYLALMKASENELHR
ncbi:hypothetical protein DRP07_11300 [Archaeoglobales archaeon]|nr:MAG: hypothetical protein DRP07_11300 [Archaeoglobales archaeon]